MSCQRTIEQPVIFAALLAMASPLAALALAADEPGGGAGPVAASNLELAAPIDRWDEAIPLGNGLTGGLLWGSGRNLKLSLDRGDLWDLRTPETLLGDDWTWTTIRKLVAEKNQARISELFDVPYNAFPYPTKIPAGRLELTLDESQPAESFRLDLRAAVVRVKLAEGSVEVFYSAEEPVTMIRVTGPAPVWRIVAPDSLKKLGYGPPETGSEGDVSWSVQEAALGLKYAVVTAGRRIDNATEIALAITSTDDGPDPLALGRERVRAALSAGYDSMLGPHVAWWRRFWSASSVRVPDARVQQHYDLVQYFYGAASRRGAPPIPLQ
ncbi:MAG: glycoside hydrolase N-terminal domain-containing protein, partial [Planctomycetota bacterium]